MSTDSQDTDFRYEGYLIFNEIFKVEIPENSEFSHGAETAQQRLEEGAEAFTEDDQTSNHRIETLNDLVDSEGRFETYVSDSLNPSDLVPMRLFYEERINTEGYLPGESRLREIELPTTSDADIYWIYPDRLYIRGSEDDTEEAADFLTNKMDARVVEQTQEDHRHDQRDDPRTDGGADPSHIHHPITLTDVSLSGDFLIWLFHKHFRGSSLPSWSRINVNRLTDAAVSGSTDIWGGDNSVGKTTDLIESPPLLSSILKKQTHRNDRGKFHFGRLFNKVKNADKQAAYKSVYRGYKKQISGKEWHTHFSFCKS